MQNARSVREDTADLASFALSERASLRSLSPPGGRRTQSQLDSYFSPAPEQSDPTANRDIERARHEAIQEVSEPVSPNNEPEPSSKSPGKSALTDMLRRSPPSRSPPSRDGGDNDDKSSEESDEEEDREDREDVDQGRLIITSNGVRLDASERTPLIQKDPVFDTHHPDWINQTDLEDPQLRRQPSWPKLRNIILWPRERGYEIARRVLSPKTWNGRAIWKNAVLDPLHNIPAVILGGELTILDALSYGTCFHFWWYK